MPAVQLQVIDAIWRLTQQTARRCWRAMQMRLQGTPLTGTQTRRTTANPWRPTASGSPTAGAGAGHLLLLLYNFTFITASCMEYKRCQNLISSWTRKILTRKKLAVNAVHRVYTAPTIG